MILWSGYVRPARVPGRVVGVARFDSIHRLGLHPAFTLRKRVNAVEVVGEAITAVAEGRYAGLAVSRQTAYGWDRDFAARTGELALALAVHPAMPPNDPWRPEDARCTHRQRRRC